MNILLVLIVLLLLLGWGGYAISGAVTGLTLGGLILIIIVVLLVTGRIR